MRGQGAKRVKKHREDEPGLGWRLGRGALGLSLAMGRRKLFVTVGAEREARSGAPGSAVPWVSQGFPQLLSPDSATYLSLC